MVKDERHLDSDDLEKTPATYGGPIDHHAKPIQADLLARKLSARQVQSECHWKAKEAETLLTRHIELQ